MRIIIAILVISLSGCASFTSRPPIIEDKVGLLGKRMIATLATAPDYRVVYVKLDDSAQLCAEAPADAGAQFSQSFAGSLSAKTKLSAEARAGLAIAMKQLFKRSQGVQFFRDGSFALCNLYLNKAITNEQYLSEIQAFRKDAKALIEKEIQYLEKITIDPIGVPTAPNPPVGNPPSNTLTPPAPPTGAPPP